LTVSAESNNPVLIPNPEIVLASPGNSGLLRFRPTANRTGTAQITVTAPLTGTYTVVVSSYTHAAAIDAAVWALYDTTLRIAGPLPTLIERDNNIPALEVLCAEAQRAERALAACSTRQFQ